MIKKINIIFVLPTLFAGGAEKIMSFISQNIDKEKFQAKLLIAGHSKDAAYDIKNIEVTYLNKDRVLYAIPQFFIFIIKNKPDIVFSSISHLNIVMAFFSLFFKKTKFIGREATISSEYEEEKKKRININKILYKKLYGKLDMIVCQSKDMSKHIMDTYNIPLKKTIIINNPISNDSSPINNGKHKSKTKHLITVGRLSKEKGILRILRILAKLDFDFTYTLIGNGDEKETIFKEAKRLNLFNKIKHIPFTKDVSSYIAKHDFFLQGSYVEGFPNSVLESCVVGTPVIAFDVPGGTKEIISNGINGFLVNTENEFINKLNTNVNFEPDKIRSFVQKKFNKEKILNEYEKMFKEI
ncbi:glycosyltransferase [Hyunsoonleella pacifica]|uniref:Glycosyltransferase n=1 Tax=Hyunsoonleella pacifica TaxID=1080224 RepID=A0A4Q9FTQ7_9FLAO|nr:glycosyltransferase [Hyunsoonleella pacifica]TBN17662.1 glycosyltransferase [Hyunsoonleella pacifica]GGD10061.1 glycosyl transferase [Hyunsoonleella pacifica]